MGAPSPLRISPDTIRMTIQVEVPYSNAVMNYGTKSKQLIRDYIKQIRKDIKEDIMQKLKEWVTYFFIWHEDEVEEFKWKFNLSSYRMLWIAFIKGIITVLLLQWIF